MTDKLERSVAEIFRAESGVTADLDGDGKVTPSEINICRMCLAAAIVIAFGDQALKFI